jgi:hypothetical protein
LGNAGSYTLFRDFFRRVAASSNKALEATPETTPKTARLSGLTLGYGDLGKKYETVLGYNGGP